MGGGSWTTCSYRAYSTSVGRDVDMSTGEISTHYASAQDMYVSKRLSPALDPKNVMRECCDSKEHPETFPVILALDVTGSMGDSAMEVAKRLNTLMTGLYGKVKDIEFSIMAIGDLAYDSAPIQISQFESDVRIAENLDKIYFEAGGGSNPFESYTAAWYMALNHCKFDCMKRGVKPLVITLGDEIINPYLPEKALARATGDGVQKGSTETSSLYEQTSQKFELYHVVVDHGYRGDAYFDGCADSFAKVIGNSHVFKCKVDQVIDTLGGVIRKVAAGGQKACIAKVVDGMIEW